MSFFVKAVWDAEAGVFYSDSNIVGLHIEAETIEEFREITANLAPELILANRPLKDEPLTDAEAERIAAGERDIENGRMVPDAQLRTYLGL